MTTDAMYKPGYEGERLSSAMSLPERQTFREGRPRLVRRLYDAMMTLTVMDRGGMKQLGASATPAYLVEFSDRVGQEKVEPRRLIFKPTAAQVSDMGNALALLEGLRPAYFKVVMLRAIYDFERYCGEPGTWTWEAIGAYVGMSGAWAEKAHTDAIVQAARRGGLLPRASRDYAVVIAGMRPDREWMSNLATGADPRQSISNLNVKSPIRVEACMAVWVNGQPLAKRVFDETRKRLRSLNAHAAWFKANPDTICQEVVEVCRRSDASWMIEDIPIRGERGALAA